MISVFYLDSSTDLVQHYGNDQLVRHFVQTVRRGLLWSYYEIVYLDKELVSTINREIS